MSKQLLEAAKDMADRFEKCLIENGTDSEFAAIAVAKARAAIAAEESRASAITPVGKHTKLPWAIDGSWIIGYPEAHIAVAHVLGNMGQPVEANARLIVSAVNSWNDPAALRARILELEISNAH